MAVAFDAGSGGQVASNTVLNITHVCTGSNLCLVVGVGSPNSGDQITGATYNGVAMTLVRAEGVAQQWVKLYRLVAPATGSHTLAISTSPASFMEAVAASFTGVDQTTPSDDNQGSNNGSQTSPSTVTVTCSTGGAAFDFMTNRTTADSVTKGGSQTQVSTQQDDGIAIGVGSYWVHDGSTAMSWTWASSTRVNTHAALALKAVAAAGGALGSHFYRLVGGMDGGT